MTDMVDYESEEQVLLQTGKHFKTFKYLKIYNMVSLLKLPDQKMTFIQC